MKIKKYFKKVLPRVHLILKDPRVCSRSWSFRELMKSTMTAIASGCKNLRQLEHLSAMSGKRIPDSTLSDLLVQVDAAPLMQEIVRGVKEASRKHELDEKELPINLVVIDGKCLSTTTYKVGEGWHRRSQKGCSKYVAMALRAFFASSSVKLQMGQWQIPQGTNERGILKEFLDWLVASYGRTKLLEVVSVDAGITSIKNAQYIIEHGLHYIMALKDPKSRKATQVAIDLLGELRSPNRSEEEFVNGKHIIRKLFRCKAPAVSKWEHAKELWRIEKTTLNSNGKITVENRYYITSLPKSRLTDRQVLKAVRMHWSIENNANWVMDTAWQEDKNPWCNKSLELISLLRMIAYNTVARFKYRKLKPDLRSFIPWKRLLNTIERELFPQNSEGDFTFA